MSWTSLDEDDATSSSDEEDSQARLDYPISEKNGLNKINGREKEAQYSAGLQKSYGHSSREQSPNPFIQEPNSDNEIHFRKDDRSQQHLKNLLASKDERIRVLQKLVNGQREQLYHFLNVSLNEGTLLELKETCRETEALNRNENMCMALDKFKYDNNLPTEQTLLRENVSKILTKIKKLMRDQEKFVKKIEATSDSEQRFQDAANSVEISCYQGENQFTDVQKLLKGTKNIQRKMHVLKIQLKKLALIEEERIDLVERVYSMPPDQRQYYANLAVIEREKIQLLCDIDKMMESYRDLKQKCRLLEETEQELNRCIESKMAELDLNKIKPGLGDHLELMNMVERGELSLITLAKDEKGKSNDDFVKLCNENAEISERLKNFDKLKQERDDFKRQIEVLVENCLRLQSEVKALRLAGKKDDLLEKLRQACLEREQLKAKLERLTKEGPGVFRIRGETADKIAEERDQLRLKLTEYLTIEEDLKSLRFKAAQSEAYRIEAERLKLVVAELEEVKAAYIALLDKNGKNSNTVTPLDREMYRNMSKQLEHFKEVEKQRERLILEISKYKYALLRQEEEVKDLVNIVDKLMDQVKFLKTSSAVNPAEGTPEGPEVTRVLSTDEEKRLDMIRNRICPENSKLVTSPEISPSIDNNNNVTSEKNTIINSIKSFLGLDKSVAKITD